MTIKNESVIKTNYKEKLLFQCMDNPKYTIKSFIQMSEVWD